MEGGEKERREGKKKLREEERKKERKGGEKKKTGGMSERQLFFSFCISLTNTSRHSGVSTVTTMGCQAGCRERKRRRKRRRRKRRSRPVIEVCGWALSHGTSVSVGAAVLLFAVLFAPDFTVNRRKRFF